MNNFIPYSEPTTITNISLTNRQVALLAAAHLASGQDSHLYRQSSTVIRDARDFLKFLEG